MIVNYKKFATEYKNILEIAYLFLILEALEFFKLVKMYDETSDTFNIRKIFWSSVFFLSGVTFCAIMALAAILYIFGYFTGR